MRDANVPLHVRTPLGEFVVPPDVLHRTHDEQVQYCYRQLGIKYDPQLAGDITVAVTLDTLGVPGDVRVTRRTWEGVTAGEVEACIRTLVRGWEYEVPSGAAPAVKEIHFTLAPPRS